MKSDLEILYTPRRVGARRAANRLVAQAMEACDGEAGSPTGSSYARYEQLGAGEWGVVFLEATSITSRSLGRLGGFVLSGATLPRYEALVGRFKAKNPDGLLLVQLTHTGPVSHPSTERVCASPDPPAGVRYLLEEELGRIQERFVSVSLLAEKAGFDGVDIKLCHGYLGNEILRPANTRPDRWGGSPENRMRLAVNVLEEVVRQRASADFLVGSRISFYENRPGGCGTAGPQSTEYDPADMLALIRAMDRCGADYVNVSGDAPAGGIADAPDEERQTGTLWAERVVKEFAAREGLALAVMGTGYSSFGPEMAGVAAGRVASGRSDFPGFGRQSWADPLFPLKLRAGGDVYYCEQCGACARLMSSQRPAFCVKNKRR